MMLESIIAALITGGLALIGVAITGRETSNKMQLQLHEAQAITNTKIENLTETVRKHNNLVEKTYMLETRASVMEEQINAVNHRINDLEKEVN